MSAAAEKGEVPLTAAERAELTRLRKLASDQRCAKTLDWVYGFSGMFTS